MHLPWGIQLQAGEYGIFTGEIQGLAVFPPYSSLKVKYNELAGGDTAAAAPRGSSSGPVLAEHADSFHTAAAIMRVRAYYTASFKRKKIIYRQTIHLEA